MNILEYENYQEIKSHFDVTFPYNTYLCCIPQDFTSVPLHWHLEMEIIYIKKGRGVVSINLTPALVQEGDIILIVPGQLHGISQHENMRMEYENILFDLNMLITKHNDICTADYLLPLSQTNILPEIIYTPQHSKYERIAFWIDRADEICKTFPPAYPLAIKGCLFSLFYELFSDWDKDASTMAADSRPSLQKLKSIIKYVENHYHEHITIETIANLCDYSQSHFMRYFKKAMGTTFINYLNDYRLVIAARLLLSSDSTVLSISEEVGFDNLSYFNRCFKKKFGTTPSLYRNAANSHAHAAL